MHRFDKLLIYQQKINCLIQIFKESNSNKYPQSWESKELNLKKETSKNLK